MKTSNSLHFTDEEDKIFWIEKVIAEFSEGSALPEEVEQLRTLLLNDPDARRIYLESNQLTILLESTHTAAPQINQTPLLKKRLSLRLLPHWTSRIAAVLVLALGICGIWLALKSTSDSLKQPEQTPWLATLSSSNKAQWAGPGVSSGKFYAGNFILKSGVAELEFQNGASFVIEGPCALEIINAEKLELEYGKIWGHCPPAARGFEVIAPGGNRIVDLGTKFAVGADPSGSVEVHVFDGEVEVFSDSQEKKFLEAGAAIHISPGEEHISLDANFDNFTNAAQLQDDRYQLHHAALLEREDLLLYYDFASLPKNPSILDDQSSSELHGRVVGAVSVQGRTTGKDALLFENKTDTVALNLRNLTLGKGFTLAMWIKPTDFQKSSMALLNSNGFSPGNIHFQIHDDGKLMTAIAGMARYTSLPNMIKTDVWQLVSVRWDLENNQAQLFLNGEPLQSIENKFPNTTPNTKAKFGQSRIGTWGKRTFGHNRNFVGRIDEVMLFSNQLSESEMTQLFEASRP